jgi:subtilisin family serine protease
MADIFVEIAKDADRNAIVSQLSLWGTVTQYANLPRTFTVTGPASSAGAILGLPGVITAVVETPDDFRLDSTHDVVQVSNDNSLGQYPIVFHGHRAANPLWGSIYDLVLPRSQATRFNYDATAGGYGNGAGVNIYVVDSGVRATHEEWTVPTNRFGGQLRDNHLDGEGFHGTAVASCAAGTKLGVAPGATVFDLKGFPAVGGASISSLVQCMDTALTHFNGGSAPGVINCSFGGDGSNGYSTIIDSCMEAGLIVVASSGNDGIDLDVEPNRWPANDPDCITVGGTDSLMRIHLGANRDGNVDIHALFHQWTTAAETGDADYSPPGRIRGTSFSGPMVAGAVARALTGTTKMTTRAQAEAFIAQFLSQWGELDMVSEFGTIDPTPRLYIPGVTRTGVVAYTPPTIGFSTGTPILVDGASLHVVLGSAQSAPLIRYGTSHAIMGKVPDRPLVRYATTHVILEP